LLLNFLNCAGTVKRGRYTGLGCWRMDRYSESGRSVCTVPFTICTKCIISQCVLASFLRAVKMTYYVSGETLNLAHSLTRRGRRTWKLCVAGQSFTWN